MPPYKGKTAGLLVVLAAVVPASGAVVRAPTLAVETLVSGVPSVLGGVTAAPFSPSGLTTVSGAPLSLPFAAPAAAGAALAAAPAAVVAVPTAFAAPATAVAPAAAVAADGVRGGSGRSGRVERTRA